MVSPPMSSHVPHPFDPKPQQGFPSISLVLYQPEIPGNTGTLMRLAACWNAPFILIGPLGFVLSNKHLKRASMDYAVHSPVSLYDSWDLYRHRGVNHQAHRTIAVVPRAGVSYREFRFKPGDHLIMGSESSGLPSGVMSVCDHIIHIPMGASARSMNLAIASALVWAEGIFQTKTMVS